MTASTIPVRHAQLRRYVLWQAGDFAFNIAIITIILFALLGVITIMSMRAQEAFLLSQHRVMPDQAKLNSFREIFAVFAMVGPIIATTGVVSSDRSSGYTRFLFAKPLSPVRYYAQALLVRFAGFLAIGIVLVALYSAFAPTGYSPRLFADLSLSFVTLGGLVFLLSVLSKYDGLVAIVFLLASSIIWDNFERSERVWHALTFLVPPISKIGDLHNWMLQTSPLGNHAAVLFPAKWAFWMAGYGLAAAVLGLYLLRRIPLTKT